MENLSHSRQPSRSIGTLSNKSCNGGSFSVTKTTYEDVFGGPPKFGAPLLSPRVEDYREIFGAFHASRASSIPVLDIPMVDDDAEVFFDVRSSGFDYSEVFGGFGSGDFAVSYEELMMDQSNGHDDSSDEAWTPAESESLSGESDHSGRNQCLPNGGPYEPVNDSMEFSTSYHKAYQNEDMSNGITKIVHSHDVSGYTYVVDKSNSMQKTDIEDEQQQLPDYSDLSMDFSGELMKGRHLRKTMSHPANGSANKPMFGNDFKPQRGYSRSGSLHRETFVTVSDVSLRTQPSQLPPPSRPPPIVDVRRGDFSRSTSSDNSFSVEWCAGDSSPTLVDVEVDASSPAAASAAAMKEAMEKAQAKLKSAKELMERKKEGLQSRRKPGSKNDVGDKKGKMSKMDSSRGVVIDERVEDACKREAGGMEYFGKDRQKVRKTSYAVPDPVEGEHCVKMVKKPAEEKCGKESRSHRSDKIEGPGEWKEATEFFELVRTDESRPDFELANNVNNLMQKTEVYELGQKEKKVTVEAVEMREESDKKAKLVREDHGLQEYEEKKVGKEAHKLGESNVRTEIGREVCRQKGHEKKVKVQEFSEGEGNEKKSGMDWQHLETEKKPTRVSKSGKHENLLKAQQREAKHEVEQTIRWKDEEQQLKKTGKITCNDNRYMEAQKREDEEKKQRDDFEWEENDRMLKEVFELAENEKRMKALELEEREHRRMQENLEREEKDKKREEASKREQNEKRMREALEQMENEKKLKEALEQDQNARLLKEALERQENEKRLKETLEWEENARKIKEAIEMQENKKKLRQTLAQDENGRKLKEQLDQEENKKKQKKACEREENERQLIEKVLEKEENGKTQKEALERQKIEEKLKGVHEKEGNEGRLRKVFEKDKNGEGFEGGFEEEASDMSTLLQGKNKDVLGLNETFMQENSRKTSKQACQWEGTEKKLKDASVGDQLNGPKKVHQEAERCDNCEGLKMAEGTHVFLEAEDIFVSSGGCKVNDHKENKKIPTESQNKEKKSETAHLACATDGKFKASHMAEGNLKHEQSHFQMEDATKLPRLDDNAQQAGEAGTGIRKSCADKTRRASRMDSDIENFEKKLAHDHWERGMNVKLVQGTLNQDGSKEKYMSTRVIKDSIESGRKMEAAQPVTLEGKGNTQEKGQQVNSGQSAERKEKNLTLDDKETERMKKERELEKDRLRKIEEEREREREREKDRMAVDRATLEARERAYAEARDKAERAAVERAIAEAQQRAMAEARERLEKACAEAREKSLGDRSSMEARLRAERAAVERATTEARERAAGKAMAERAAFETTERVERSVSDKFSASSRNSGIRLSSSSSDLQDLQFQSTSSFSGARFPYSSVYGKASSYTERSEGVQGESAQRCKARLERHRRTAERAAKALAEKNMRDLLAQREQAERNRLAETLDADVKRWLSGKEGNLRALLSTLQYILGPDSGWVPIPLTEVITSAAVKKAYRKATLCVHPDKLQQRGASIQQKYICEKVFDLLKEAWSKFNSEER